jgi:hypothetical protein
MLVMRREEEVRKQRVAQRLQRQMGNVLLDADGGFGRCKSISPKTKVFGAALP